MTDEKTDLGQIDKKTKGAPAKVEPANNPPEPAPADGAPRDVILHSAAGAETGPDIGSGTVSSPVRETFLQTDHVVQHYEDDVNNFQTLGQGPDVPLPLAGAGGSAVKPEEAFRAKGQ